MSEFIGTAPNQVTTTIIHGVDRYLNGMVPGDFIFGGLSNDFMQCVTHADHDNAKCLLGFAMLLYNCVDSRVVFSADKVRDYLEGRGWDNEKKAVVRLDPEVLARYRAGAVDYYRDQVHDIFHYDVEKQEVLVPKEVV